MKRHHKPYYFDLHTIALLKEMDMVPNYLYEGWRTIPKHLRDIQARYLNGESGGWSSEKQLKNIILRDTSMYYGILDMLKTRVKRISNTKCEKLISDNHKLMGVTEDKPQKTKQGFVFKCYRYNMEVRDIMNKRSMILHFQSEFVRTGQVKNITHLRKLDKELVSEIKEFLKNKK